MGISVVNKLVIDEVNCQIARRISYVASTSRLTAEQKAQNPTLLAKGAEAYGFRGDVWTASRVAEVIKRTFGVRYHRDHVGRLMREAGWSRQKPVERASQRNEEAIKKWSEERWPEMKKKPRRTKPPSSG